MKELLTVLELTPHNEGHHQRRSTENDAANTGNK